MKTIKNPARKTGIAILVLILGTALFAPMIAPHDPDMVGIAFSPPTARHLLGTNDMGQDVLSRLVHATGISLKIGLCAALISILIGVVVGAAAGFFSGWTEEVLMGFTDLFLLIPGLPLMIILSAYLEPGVMNIIIVIGMLWWCPTARIIHSKVLQLKNAGFVQSAGTMGYSRGYVLVRHIIPNTREIIYAKFSLAVVSAMMSEAALAFLGLGASTDISWGTMLSFAFQRGGLAGGLWWWYLPPGIMICLSCLGFVLLTFEDKKLTHGFKWLRA